MMVDIAQQIEHWRSGAFEDWQVAGELLQSHHVRQALFFVHLAIEKALKATVCRHTEDLAPRTHNLVRLTEIAGLELSREFLDTLAETNEFALSGRYPDTTSPTPSAEEAVAHQRKAEEVFQWLMRKL